MKHLKKRRIKNEADFLKENGGNSGRIFLLPGTRTMEGVAGFRQNGEGDDAKLEPKLFKSSDSCGADCYIVQGSNETEKKVAA